VLVIIQARSSSQRFKGKILKMIYGKPLINHVISRVQKAKKVVEYLKKIKVQYYRGNLSNVAQRMIETAEHSKKKNFIRISGDSPLIDPDIIDKAISIFKKNKNYDLISNIFPRTFPKGQSIEIICTYILKKHLKNMNKFEKEHVTQYFYKNPKIFLIKNFINIKKIKFIKTAIDNKKDLANILKKIKKNEFEKYSIYKS
jgi:spore coat polysaccharide biosynthesis protein SpsF